MPDDTIAEPLGPDDPQEIGSFNILGLLGTGGMGEVYLGATERGYAAVKRVRPRLVSSERFEREIGILYRVPIGVAPRVLASDGTAERPWFATEYVPGLTVDEAVRLRGPLPAEALWLLLAETAAQLRAVHAVKIVHRDVKPGNLMLVRDGVKLIDFGIARAADQARLTKSGGSYGTQGFTAPEQQAGDEDVDAPADVYSLGALLLYAASGRTPGVVPDFEPLRSVDGDLAAVVESCLATAPRDRPTADRLVETARGHLSTTPPSWPTEVMSRISSRRDFAATPVGKLETVPPPNLDAHPGPATVPASDDPLPRHPRKRLLLLSTVTVVAFGALMALVFIPSATGRNNIGQSSSDYASISAQPPVRSTQTSSASPSRPASSSGESTPATPAVKAGTDTSVPPSEPSARSGSGTASAAASPPAAAGASPTASAIGGINGNDDSAQVKGSEADTDWVGEDAACSAWLDDDGSGGLAGVVNTSLGQTCDAELHRGDGMAFGFSAAWNAAKTNFISDVGETMWICVWNASDQSDAQCSAHFAMNGDTPVKD